MPQYFFELSDGTETLEDVEGCPLPDAASARNQAIKLIGGLLKHHASFFGPNWSEWEIHVKQEEKGIVLSVPFMEVYSLKEALVCSSGSSATTRLHQGPNRPSRSSVRQAALNG
jgi:hypothetical protein